MKTKVAIKGTGCPWCAGHQHRRCVGFSALGPCGCAEQGHNPDDVTAAGMRAYHHPEPGGETLEQLAAEYRAADS